MPESQKHSSLQIRWQSYRSFADTGWIDVRPVTILIGPNNSGKTSILHPLILMAQTMLSRYDIEHALVTRGDLIDVGSFRDFVHKHNIEDTVRFSVRFHVHNRKELDKNEPIGTYPPGAISIDICAGDRKSDIYLKGFRVYDVLNRLYVSMTRTKTGRYRLGGKPKLSNMLPEEKKTITKQIPTNFLFAPSSILYGLSQESDQDHSPELSFSEDFQEFLSVIGISHSMVTSFLHKQNYLGPLRDRPRRYYETLAEDPKNVGATGKFTAALIHTNQALRKKLDFWVHEFAFGDSVRAKSITDHLFSVEFHRGNEATNIADAGFGASQLLPLIVQALTGDKGSLSIAEQPEIHLNPRLQSRLADLFVEMANGGQRALVETHSEHLLLRLRRLVAEGKISADNVAVYFVEREDGKSTVRPVPIKENGHIDQRDWPSGFFQEPLEESIALATAQSRRRNPRQQ